MSKRRKHQNIRKRGGKDDFEPISRRRNSRLRPIKKPKSYGLLKRIITAIGRIIKGK